MRHIYLAAVAVVVLTACSSSTDVGHNREPDYSVCAPGPYFTELPVAASSISYFLVLGEFNPPGDIVPRGQTGLQLTSNALTPVRAVGDLEIVSVQKVRWLESPWRAGHSDYSLTFEIPQCRAIFGVFGHLAELTPTFESRLSTAQCEVYSTESETVESCRTQVSIPVPAGQLLGQAGGTITGLDFDLFDRRVTFNYVAGHRYPQARWAICPQDLFIASHREFLLSKTGLFEARRTAEPRCGTMEIDVAGTAQGMWVLDGHDVVHSAETHDRFFALTPHEIYADSVQSIVTAHPAMLHPVLGMRIQSYSVKDEGRVNRRWRDLPGDGTVFCFAPDEWVGYQPATDMSMLAAFGADGKVTLETRTHPPNQSFCYSESPESWAFSGSALRLMR